MKSSKLSTLMVIDDDEEILSAITSFFKQKNYKVLSYNNATKAINDLENKKQHVDVILSDFQMPIMNGFDFIKKTKDLNISIPIIIMTAAGSLENSLQAIETGAYDFILKPIHYPQLLISIQRAIFLTQVQNENIDLKSSLSSQGFMGLDGVVGRSLGFKKAMDLAKRVSNSQANVLISGESGSGKEVVAKAIHNLGDRKNQPFIAINCSAIPENLLESELFGYKKGSFPGASNHKMGLFEEANNGTLFLDEVGDLSLALQVKLLRILQDRKIKRIGDTQSRDLTARIVCATNKNLKKEIAAGRFREDLFFRLNIIPIYVPPLRHRIEDVLPLSEYFLKKFILANNSNKKSFTKDTIHKLESLHWQGNVRELENTIERAVVLSITDKIEVSDLPAFEPLKKPLDDESFQAHFFEIDSILSLSELSNKYIECVYNKNNHAKDKTAKDLGIDRKTLYRKLKTSE